MKLKTLIGVMGILLPILSTTAQDIRPLNIGDTMPDITFSVLQDGKLFPHKISDYSGKLLVLDFWDIYCTACIGNFPKITKLEEDYKGKVSFLGVTEMPDSIIRRFFSTHETIAGKPYSMATITGDRLISRLFPHKIIPHMVWIAPNGTIRAITGGEALQKETIDKLLEGTSTLVKQDIDHNRPLFLSDNFPPNDSLVKYSILIKGAFNGSGSGPFIKEKNGVVYGRQFSNCYLEEIYRMVMPELFRQKGDIFFPNRRIVELKDSGDFFIRKLDSMDFDLTNQYQYEYIVPLNKADSLCNYILEDLNRMTGYNVHIAKRTVSCLVLQETKDNNRAFISRSSGKKKNTLFLTGYPEQRIHNYHIADLIGRLNFEPAIGACPVVDGTGYQGLVDITISGEKDLEALRNDLRKAGLDLIKENREINMLIVSK